MICKLGLSLPLKTAERVLCASEEPNEARAIKSSEEIYVESKIEAREMCLLRMETFFSGDESAKKFFSVPIRSMRKRKSFCVLFMRGMEGERKFFVIK